MTRARSFTKSEIMDAARAAAETGLTARLCPTGEIVFSKYARNDNVAAKRKTPEDQLQEWLSGRQTQGAT